MRVAVSIVNPKDINAYAKADIYESFFVTGCNYSGANFKENNIKP
jgi:hypothetical protein